LIVFELTERLADLIEGRAGAFDAVHEQRINVAEQLHNLLVACSRHSLP